MTSKTPEELAEEAINERWKISDMPTSREGYVNTLLIRIGGYKDGFLAGYQAAAPQWISVKDRLPENSFMTVLVDFKVPDSNAKLFSIGYYEQSENNSGEWYVQSNRHREKVEVAHWMPLPQPPKEEV